ncbi:D-alanine--poly(phosphoribitol) ligase [Streptomyces sp. NRRL F-4489]|uniref:AMP-binding protein n=1 Tax=Streptomyces sp. NRRL F-4489 TaxID=1609095 RepID=UPI00074710BE|nr:AMP-binding protein [Streptomyces sp. NRRL F-4489]KUL37874.1 D-alanine--poly(phosphoribitol) ligase [Streptomyces sp. NRRL F-4489]
MTTPAAAPRTLHDWFAASAARHGDRPALEVAGTALSYAALAGRADALAAHLLHRLGTGTPPRRIGLLAARSAVAYAGYLAVQRLGAAVVPLGPGFPPGRNAAVARAAGLDAVLADATAAPGPLGVPVVALTDDDLAALPAAAPDADPAGPDDLAYLLFTSGSTGVPKGVPIRHRNIGAYLGHVVPRTAAGPGDRFSQTFDLTFDPSVHDMFTAWGSGATLVVPTRGELLAPVRFATRRALTHWNSVPSLISLAQRLRALKPGSMPTLRHSMFCGEPLTLQQAAAWHRAAPDSTLENAYGPTELTVTCTAYRLPADPAAWPAPANGTVPIGPLHPGLQLRLHGGELCVRGDQRFPGYLDPADNTGRFLAPDGTDPDPAAPLTDAQWYRTGDRVAPLPGAPGDQPPLVHLGRDDQQIQVHGYRVELGEVEAALRALPGVLDAAVLPVPTPGGTELTAAYTGDGPAPAPDALRTALRDRLPAYMVPATLTALDSLPLNRNGKLDRAALAAALSVTGLAQPPAAT